MKNITVLLKRGNQNWILGAWAKDIRHAVDAKLLYFPMKKRQLWTLIKFKLFFRPEGKIVIMHQELFYLLKKASIDFNNCETIVWYTHHRGFSDSDLKNMQLLKSVDKIAVASTQLKNDLVSRLGFEIERAVKVVIGGADLSYFKPLNSTRKIRSVIFTARFADRKRPDLIFRTVLENTEFDFTLHGKGWEKSCHLENLKRCNNFHYIEFNSENSNFLYNQANIFISLSDNEGGPIPALEALAAGCKVILTDTGFARDLKKLSNSVIIIPTNPTSIEVNQALNECLNLSDSDLSVIENFDYDRFLREMIDLPYDYKF